MATAYKVLGTPVAPAATTATTLYTVPALTSAVVSTIVICTQAASAATFRISVRQAGAVQTTALYLAYDVAIAANDSTALTLGITLATTDVITVYSSSTTLSFNAFGSEIS